MNIRSTQHDYDVLKEIFPNSSRTFESLERTLVFRAQRFENERERRVARLYLKEYSYESLPASIGKLKYLTYLDLRFSKIESLPVSIGRLKNLETLSLCFTENMTKLPEEIEGLTSLKHLNLRGSPITSLPAAIGHLKSLEDLDLGESGVTSFPNSIGELQSLTHLWLDDLRSVTSLPGWVGEMKNLEALCLGNANSTMILPATIGNLKNLREFGIARRAIVLLEGADKHDSLLMLASRCRSLGTIARFDRIGYFSMRLRLDVNVALARNRARTKFPFRISHGDSMVPKLWPFLLCSATKRFYDRLNNTGWSYNRSPFETQSDAIYELLIDGAESFLGVLIHRNASQNVVQHALWE